MMKNILAIILFGYSFISSSQTTIYSEDFEGTTVAATTYTGSGGTGGWSINNNFSISGTKSDSAAVLLSDTVFLESNTINASGYVFLFLDFKQICKIDFFDEAIIQVSNNNGSTWTTLTSSEYRGTGFLSGNAFSSVSYTIWDAGVGTAVPQPNWWQSESYDITSLGANATQLKVRFCLIDADNNGSRSNYGWLVDDIVITGGACELVPPTISLTGTVYQGVIYTAGPYTIQADIQDASGISSATLSYTINGGAPSQKIMVNSSGNIYEASVLGVGVGDTICYTITALDGTTCQNSAVFPNTGCTEFMIRNSPPATCVGSPIGSFNYLETFATFPAGNGQNNNPGTIVNDWENEQIGDTHNWYVINQATPSNNTGPSSSHSPSDANYLYIESSGQLSNETAILNTPCYDLNGLLAPTFSFWYHMFGATMGELHVDVFFGNQWVLDIMPAIIGNQGDQWVQQQINLSQYTGSIIKLRFRGITGNGYTSDIAIDDIEIIEPIAFDIKVNSLVSPNSNGCSGSATEFITINIENLGASSLTEIPLAYTLNGGATVRDTAKFNLLSGGAANHTFQQSINMSIAGNYSIDVWAELPSDGETSNDSIINNVISTSTITTMFPDTSNFDMFTVGNPGVLLNGWSNDQLDAHDWYVNTNGTPSGQTGPSGDNTSGTGNYLYMEATNLNNLEASLVSQCYDISSLNSPELTFFYHMSGIEMGELHLDLIINGFKISDIINPYVGDQGANWNQQIVDLSPFKGVVKLVFRGMTGNGYRSDIALDDVSIRDARPVGINESKNEVHFSLFPNPAVDEITVISNEFINRFEIIDITGKLVFSKLNATSTLFKVDISTLAPGIYFTKVYSNNGVNTKKIVKE